MKKFLLFFTMLVLSVATGFAQEDNDGWKTATKFDWSTGNEQAANTTEWHQVVLKGHVAEGENVLLYLNNLESSAANVEVTIYTVVRKTVYGTTTASAQKLEGPESKSIAANRNYAYEIGGSIIKNFGLDTVYLKLTTDKKLRFAAEPVEPGEKDVDCLNAAKLNIPGTLNYTNLNKNSWYQVDLAAIKADASKTLTVSIKNTGSAAAHLTAGVSFDCPSTGVTEESTTLAVGQTKTKVLDRKYLDMLAEDIIYLRINSDVKVSITATESVNSDPVTYTDVVSPIDLDMDQYYSLASGVEQWYSVDLKKAPGKLLPEVVVENEGSATANIDAIVVYETHASAYADRSFTLGAKAVKVQEIERNVVNNAIKMTAAKQGVDTGIVYVRVKSNQNIKFMARMKKRTEGTACASAKLFDWKNGNTQAGNTTAWYAIDIADAKAAVNKDIKLTITNKSSKTATVAGQVAFECPYTSTTDANRSIPANQTKSGTLKQSLYKHLVGDTIWVGLTTDQNIEFTAELVDATIGETTCVSSDATEFKTEANEDGTSKQTLAIPTDTTWYKIAMKNVMVGEQIPEVNVKNMTSSKANIRVDVTFDCPCEVTALQGRTLTIAGDETYTYKPASDLLNSVSADTAWIRVITDQPLTAWTKLVYEDEGASCSKATVFNWTSGEVYEPDAAHWYAVNIKEAKDNKQNIKITIRNMSSESAKITADITFECPVVDSPTSYSYTAAPGATREKVLTYSMFEKVKSDIVYIKITSTQKLDIKAELEDDTTPAIDVCSKNPTPYDWKNGNDLIVDFVNYTPGDTAWFVLPLDTFEKDDYALVPTVKIENYSTTDKVNLTGIAAFSCVVKSPMSRTMSIGAATVYQKSVERDMMKAYTDPSREDTVYIGIVADQSIHFEIEFTNPDQGQDCYHAVDFDWTNGNTQDADATVWYDINLKYVKDQPGKSARIGIENLDGFTGLVVADMFFTCEEDSFANYSYTLQQNADKKYELGRELFTNMKVDHIFLRLYSAQQVHVYAELYDVETITPIDACLDATPITYNVDIAQTKDSVWYVVNLKDIREKTDGDAKLTVKNTDSSDAQITAAISYACPVVEKMLDKTITLASGATYEKVASRKTIDNTTADSAWLLIVTDKAISFRLDLIDPRGSECGNPIIVDWENGNLHPADSTYWYKIELDTFYNDTILQRDLRLTLENLVSPENVNLTAEIYMDCPTPTDPDPAASRTYSFTETEKSKDITRAFIANSSNPVSIFLKYKSDKNTKLNVSLIDPLPKEKDTTIINDTICLKDPNYAPQGVAWLPLEDTVIYTGTLDVDSFVVKRNQTEMADSLVFHNLVVVKPVEHESAIIEGAGGAYNFTIPTVKAGQAIDVAAATADVTTKLAALAKAGHNELDTVIWQVQDTVTKAFSNVTADLLPTTVKDINVRFVAQFIECSDAVTYSDTITLKADAPQYFVDTLGAVVCSGETFVSKKNILVTVDEDFEVYSDTIEFALSATELADSVFVYNYSVKKTPAKQALTTLPTYDCGGHFDLSAATVAIQTAFNTAKTDQDAAISTVTWEYVDGVDFVALTEADMFSTDVKSVTVRYVATTECGDLIEGDDVTVNAKDNCIDDVLTLPNDTVCVNSTYDFWDGSQVVTETITGDLLNQTYKFKYTAADGREGDSTRVYNIYVYRDITIPALATTDSIKAVCGEEVVMTSTIDELQAELDAALAADPLAEPVKSVVWEVEDKNGNWNDIKTSPITMDPAMSSVNVRYTVTTECNTYTATITVPVVKRTSETLSSIKKYTAISRYEGWLLMVDQKNLQIDYPEIDSTMVKWYKVNGVNDVVDPSDPAADDFLGTGWYYTEGKQLVGEYYARIDLVATVTEPCGETILSETITISSTSSAPQLSPSMVAPRETLYLNGLSSEKAYTISVYDLMGNLVERYQVDGLDSFSFEAQDNAGYYMVNIESDTMKETLKYIVK